MDLSDSDQSQPKKKAKTDKGFSTPTWTPINAGQDKQNDTDNELGAGQTDQEQAQVDDDLEEFFHYDGSAAAQLES